MFPRRAPKSFNRTTSSAYGVGLELNEKVAGFGIVRDKTTHFREQSIMLTGKIVNAGGPRTNFAKTSMYEGKAS